MKNVMKNAYFAALAALSLVVPFAAHAQTYAYDSSFGVKGATDGKFNSPFGITLDSGGNLYVADQLNSRIAKFNSKGVFVANIGNASAGAAKLNSRRT